MASPLDNYGRVRNTYVGCLPQEFRFRVAVLYVGNPYKDND